MTTTPLPDRVDLLIVGAGTAGAACAFHAARAGLRVLNVDAGPLDAAGARWVNGIAHHLFEDAGIAIPQGEELLGEGAPFHMFVGRSRQRITVRDHRHLEVDMRALVRRLQQGARDAGAVLLGEVRVEAVKGETVTTTAGAVRADVIVDASGLSGIRLLDQPRTSPRNLCAAAQGVYALADPQKARAFLEDIECHEGDTICFSGLAGGYSILNVTVAHGEVALLSGSVPAEGHPSGQKIIDDFIEEVGFVGAQRFGGKRAIPLGRAHTSLARDNHALLGDAGRQVFAAHGSGIGAGMTAARMLVQAVAHGGGPEDYNTRWQREHGGLFAAYDVFRRFSQRLEPAELMTLFTAGVLDAEGVAAGLSQRFPRPDASLLLRMGPAVVQAGALGRRLVKTGAKMAALRALYAAYPASGSRSGWERQVARVCRDRDWEG